MFVWRKRVSTVWLAANEAALREVAGRQLAIISRPDRTTAIAEIAGSSRRDLEKIRSRFGGAIEKLLRDWLTKFSKAHAIKPIRIVVGHLCRLALRILMMNGIGPRRIGDP